MTRAGRIAMEVLGPPLLALIYLNLYAWLSLQFPHQEWSETATMTLGRMSYWNEFNFFSIALAYIVGGCPALFYATVMEAVYAKGLSPRSWWTVGLSTLLGPIAGVAINLAFRTSITEIFGSQLTLPGVGLAVGLTLGIVIKFLWPNNRA